MILFSDHFARHKECGNSSQTPEELITTKVTLNKLYWSSIFTIGSSKITVNIIPELLSPSLRVEFHEFDTQKILAYLQVFSIDLHVCLGITSLI